VKTVEIKNRWTGAVLYATQVDDGDQFAIRTAVERAVADGANLRGANLRGAYLDGANLRGAYLDGANLDGANLRGAKYEDVPLVRNLDAKILKTIESGDGVLAMNDWHTCETTHCRAGWAVHLAGEAGYELERQLGSPAAAGALIYARSTGRVPDFYCSDEDALADIVACAADQGASV
jgi:uncharacterized protein YjbI with pentapeptide repeats